MAEVREISELIKEINLASVVEAAGIDLNRSDFGLCPFHDEKTPSFKVFDDNRFYCFGCHASGDAIDFIREFYGLGFKSACSHLGIELVSGKRSKKIRAEILARKRKKELLEQFGKCDEIC
ncbi:MAG: hypothetical protein JRE65_11180 [Deltaproteobacteria bacterium]|jgi:DNA primase|nr:hypothetical protein [Deltaproteobacteria bacterium]